ncbi:MAG: alpha/beta fold hydrolase [Paludibacter sp.]|nr:alpha/beta fold hydrolase [Paludibacter sp.]
MCYYINSLTITVNDLTVSYIDEGSTNSQTIIFIHGFPLNKSMWEKQIEVFKENFRVIAYDIRGHGNTDAGNVNFSIELFVKDLLCLMDALKIDKAILCGFSMGGYIALNAIEHHPERFNALLLCDTNCTADSSETKENRMKTIEIIKVKGLELYTEESLKKLFAPISYSNHIEEIAAVREMIMNTSLKSLYKTLHALAERSETCTRLFKIKVPVLILVGKDDVITSPDVALSMHEKMKGSIMHTIDHAGHMSNMENSKDFNNQISGFLS